MAGNGRPFKRKCRADGGLEPKRVRFDEDLWLIELDVAEPERFIVETGLKVDRTERFRNQGELFPRGGIRISAV